MMIRLVVALVAVVIVVALFGALFHWAIPAVTALSVLGFVLVTVGYVFHKGTNK